MWRKASATVPVLILIGLIGGAIVMQNPSLVPTLGDAVENLDVDAILASFSGTDSEACNVVKEDVKQDLSDVVAGSDGGGNSTDMQVSCTCTETGNITESGQKTGEITAVLYTVSGSGDGTFKGFATVVEEAIDTNNLYRMNDEYIANVPKSYYQTINDGLETCSVDV